MLIPPKSLISRNLALCDEGRIPSSNTVKKKYIKNTYQSFLHCFSTVLVTFYTQAWAEVLTGASCQSN